jgi:hypothetical protein
VGKETLQERQKIAVAVPSGRNVPQDSAFEMIYLFKLWWNEP